MGFAQAMAPTRGDLLREIALQIRTRPTHEAARALARHSEAFPELLAVRTALAEGGSRAALVQLRVAMEDPA